MKIEKLKLSRFGNHADTDISLEQINVFVGSNGAGKSTIKQALEYLLTGRVYGVTDAVGRGHEVLAQTGEKSGHVAAVIDGLNVSREIGKKLQGMEEPPGREVLSALLNTSRFLDLPQKEQQALLFSLLGFSFSTEKIKEHLRAWPDIGEKEMEVFESMINVTDGGPEVFEKIYKLFYGERTAVKRVLKELEAQAKESVPVDLPGKAWDSREQIRSDLQLLKEQQKKLIKKAGAAQGDQKRRQTVLDDIARLEAEKQLILDDMAALSTGDAAAEKNLQESTKEKLAVLQENQEKISAELQEKRNVAAVLNAEINILQDTLRKINDGAGRCLTFPDAECLIDWKSVSGDIEDSFRDKIAELQALDEGEKELLSLLEEMAHEVETGRQLLQDQKNDLWEHSRLQEQLKGVEDRLEFFRREQKELAGMEDTSGSIQEEIDQLGERIKKGEALVEKLAVLEGQMAAQKNLREKLHRVREEVGALEKLVEAFGPAGIRSKLLDQVVEKLHARVNERLQLLAGGKYRVKFVMPDFAPVMEKDGVTVKKFSTGERFLLGVVIQDVLAGLAGLRLLVIDDINQLDQQNKNALMGLLLKIRQDYDTVLLFSALGEVTPKNPGISGVAVWLVENGRVGRV